jgi:transposase
MDDERRFCWWVGIDWATEAHQVCVLDADGKVVDEFAVAHSGAGLAQLVDTLTQLAGEPASVAVAIEVPRGAVVETLVERGFAVFAINPKQLDRFRDRYTTAGAKDDRRDAFVAAASLRTDLPCFRRVQLDDPLIIQLRELSRMEEDLGDELGRLANRLREQLLRFYPQLLRLCPAADEPWLWSLLDLAPTPERGARLRPNRVERLLREHRIRRFTPEDLVTQLREPALRVAPGVADASAEHIALLLPRLVLLREQRRRCHQRMDALLEALGADGPDGETHEHRDAKILLSLPGVGRTVAAAMLGEASQPLAERNYHMLRGLAGTAPVTRQSGKRRDVVMRRACNGRLRNAVHYWASHSIQHDPRSKAHYAVLRSHGHTHGRALRGVADRLLGVLISMLTHRSPYDAARRSATQVAA